MSAHTYRTIEVAVPGGDLHVGIWDPVAPQTGQVLLVHGVTSSHLAWPFVVEELPGIRAIAPDLRGRGRSNEVAGPAGLAAHADDLAAVLDHLGIEKIPVVGHSMGAFVSVVFAHRHPSRVESLLLVDGGMPLDVPAGMDADAVASYVLGPTAARLSMRFGSIDDYLEFWRPHPAFAQAWSPELESYFAYDLVDDGSGMLRPATSYETMVDDTIDMNTGSSLPDALADLQHPTTLITVPRGLQGEEPGLYAPEYLEGVLATYPSIEHTRLDDLNHYTIVMSEQGARVVGEAVRSVLAQPRSVA
jgi:pimeloyl-ACP methyl ester carboxylesterase